jgi:hypothetical protein
VPQSGFPDFLEFADFSGNSQAGFKILLKIVFCPNTQISVKAPFWILVVNLFFKKKSVFPILQISAETTALFLV